MAMNFRDDIAELSSGKTIRVVVSAGRQKITKDIFVKLLEAKSGWFKEEICHQPIELSDDEEEHDENIMIPESRFPTGYAPIVLPEIDRDAFLEFHKWLVLGSLKVDDATLLVKSYQLAHTFRSEGMRNQLLDDVREYFAANRHARVSLECMLQLAKDLPPHAVPNNGQNRLLEFLVWQLTYEIVTRGAERYEDNEVFWRLLAKSTQIVRWHWKALLTMNPSPAALKHKRMRAKRMKQAAREEGTEGEGEDEDEKLLLPKRIKLTAPENPAEKVGCYYHEHHESRECSQGVLGGRKRKRTVVIDP